MKAPSPYIPSKAEMSREYVPSYPLGYVPRETVIITLTEQGPPKCQKEPVALPTEAVDAASVRLEKSRIWKVIALLQSEPRRGWLMRELAESTGEDARWIRSNLDSRIQSGEIESVVSAANKSWNVYWWRG